LLLAWPNRLGKALASFVLDNPTPDQLQTLQYGAIRGVMFIARILSGITGATSGRPGRTSPTSPTTKPGEGHGPDRRRVRAGLHLGPAIGGVLSRWGYAVPALAAAGLATAHLIGIIAFLPEYWTKNAGWNLPRQKSVALISFTGWSRS